MGKRDGVVVIGIVLGLVGIGCFLVAVIVVVGYCRSPAAYLAAATPTPDVLDLSLAGIQRCCGDMTQLQESQYLQTLVGRRVHWRGTVDNATTAGTLWVLVDGTLVEIKGAPVSVAAGLRKEQAIDFVAVITKAEHAFLRPGVELRYESLRGP